MYYGCNQIKESWPLSQVHIYVGHVCHLQSSVSFSFLKMIKLWNFNFFLARGIFLCKQSWKSFTQKVKRISIPLMMSNKIAKVVDCANCGKAGDIFVCWTHFFFTILFTKLFFLSQRFTKHKFLQGSSSYPYINHSSHKGHSHCVFRSLWDRIEPGKFCA